MAACRPPASASARSPWSTSRRRTGCSPTATACSAPPRPAAQSGPPRPPRSSRRARRLERRPRCGDGQDDDRPAAVRDGQPGGPVPGADAVDRQPDQAMSGLPATNLPPINAALEPADIRSGDARAKQAYQEALGFEDILMQQLTQQLAATVTSPGGDASDSGDSGDGFATGLLGSDPSTNAFASMIPTALTQSIMSGGGVGIADRIARAIDPQIGAKK